MEPHLRPSTTGAGKAQNGRDRSAVVRTILTEALCFQYSEAHLTHLSPGRCREILNRSSRKTQVATATTMTKKGPL